MTHRFALSFALLLAACDAVPPEPAAPADAGVAALPGWARLVPGALDVSSVAVDGRGHTYVTGRARAPIFMDGVALPGSADATIAFLLELDASGQALRGRSYLGDEGTTGLVDAEVQVAGDHVLVAAKLWSTVDVGGVRLEKARVPDFIQPDWALAMYDKAGALRWARVVRAGEMGRTLLRADGSVDLVGTTASDGTEVAGLPVRPGLYVARLDANGTTRAVRSVGVDGYMTAAVALGDGGLAVAVSGQRAGVLDGEPSPPDGRTRAAILAFDRDGALVWRQTAVAAPSGNAVVQHLALLSGGDLAAAGRHLGTLTLGDVDLGGDETFTPFLARLSSRGAPLGLAPLGPSTFAPAGLAATANGGLAAAGWFTDEGVVAGRRLVSAGSGDALVLIGGDDGAPADAVAWGNDQQQTVLALAVSGDGLVVGGSTARGRFSDGVTVGPTWLPVPEGVHASVAFVGRLRPADLAPPRPASTAPMALVPAPSDLYIVVDHSRDMAPYARAVADGLWGLLRAPGPGASVALRHEPSWVVINDTAYAICNRQAYENPDLLHVGPTAAPNLEDWLYGPVSPAGSVVDTALTGGVAYARALVLRARDEVHAGALVVLTRGASTPGCGGADPAFMIAAVTAAATGRPHLPTYVLTLGVAASFLDDVAAAGGTGAARVIDADDATAGVSDRLREIQAELACTRVVPGVPLTDPLEVVATDATGAASVLPRVAACAADGRGWRSDDPEWPRAVVLCPASCREAARATVRLGGASN